MSTCDDLRRLQAQHVMTTSPKNGCTQLDRSRTRATHIVLRGAGWGGRGDILVVLCHGTRCTPIPCIPTSKSSEAKPMRYSCMPVVSLCCVLPLPHLSCSNGLLRTSHQPLCTLHWAAGKSSCWPSSACCADAAAAEVAACKCHGGGLL
jgi:hypothetical protein